MNSFIREFVRLKIIEADGRVRVTDLDISGPVTEAAKTLDWVVQVVERDGGKVVDARFGTKQAGLFHERVERRVPLVVQGWRRMSAHLR